MAEQWKGDEVTLLARGVFVAPYRNNGRPVLIAVDSFGNCQRTMTVRSDRDEVRLDAVRRLETLLNLIDGEATP